MFELDKRVGCVAVRDRSKPDPSNGCHPDDENVLGYWWWPRDGETLDSDVLLRDMAIDIAHRLLNVLRGQESRISGLMTKNAKAQAELGEQDAELTVLRYKNSKLLDALKSIRGCEDRCEAFAIIEAAIEAYHA